MIRDLLKISSMKQAAEKGCKYSVPLSLRNNDPIPYNRTYVENRMKSLKKKFDNDKKKDSYVNHIERYISKGYAERLNSDDLEGKLGRISYLSDFGVVHPHALTRITL